MADADEEAEGEPAEPSQAAIRVAGLLTLRDWAESYSFGDWDPMTQNQVLARRNVLRDGIAHRVGTQVRSIRLTDRLLGALNLLGVCEELRVLVAARRATLSGTEAPTITAADVASLWTTCELARLPRGDGSENCEFRAHAICEILAAAQPALGIHRLSKIWLKPGTVFGPAEWDPPVEWRQHVAPLITTSAGDLVIDPLLATGPCTVADWVRLSGAALGAYRVAACWESLGFPAQDVVDKLDEWVVLDSQRGPIDQAKQLVPVTTGPAATTSSPSSTSTTSTTSTTGTSTSTTTGSDVSASGTD